MFKHLEHPADIGILAEASTLEEAFVEGAKGMFSVMCDLSTVKAEHRIEVTCEAGSIETLFVEWLNALLLQADLHSMFFSRFKVQITKRADDSFKLAGFAWGEEIDAPRHKIGTEVKAATYSGLKYKEERGIHSLQCLLDI